MRSRAAPTSSRLAARLACLGELPSGGVGAALVPPYGSRALVALLVGAVVDDRSLPLTAADAERRDAAPRVAPAHLVQQGDEDPAAAGSDRVPERDCPAMGIDPFGVDVQLPQHGVRVRGERLVELEQRWEQRRAG